MHRHFEQALTNFNSSLCEKQKLSLDDKTSDMRISEVSERSLISPLSEQSPATYENSNIAIYEVQGKHSTWQSTDLIIFYS